MNTLNTPSKALITDDEPDICELAEITLNRMGIDTRAAYNISAAKKYLQEETFDLCITDMNLPDGNGIELVEYIQQNHPELPVAVITAYGNMESAVRALKAGAFDFVSKPIDLQVFRDLVNSAIKLSTTTKKESPESQSTYTLIGHSPQTQQLKQKIAKLSRSQAPVFIHGESGSGKELAARLIHEQGARAEQTFVAVNCGAIPDELMESEFFGHKKGSFTGATSDKDGLFKAADRGTLFLDEVADLPLHMQVKLLRAIQEKSIRPIGDHSEQSVDIRLLSASHKNLNTLVKQGKFREDLYYRINVIELDVPSLKERSDDIPALAEHLLTKIAEKSSLPSPTLTEDALKKLTGYHFPGNIRELENILERSIALIDGDTLHSDDIQLPESVQNEQPVVEETKETPDSSTLDINSNQKELITQALEKTHWNKTAAAKLLGLTPRQLSYRIQKLGIK